jgi:integrase
MHSKQFVSAFSERLIRFIAEKTASGYPYTRSKRLLRKFDSMCSKKFPYENNLTREICLEWAVRKETEGNNTFANRLCPIREFARYLNRIGETAFVIPINFVKSTRHHTPYIYSQAEIATILKNADEIKPVCRSRGRELVIPAVLRTLYCCGMRPIETCQLHTSDVDLVAGKLKILESKGYKDRLILMADDLTEYLRNYDVRISLIFPNREWFFPGPLNGQTTVKNLEYAFNNIRKQSAIQRFGGQLPRLYDLRHTFATHRLYQWMNEKSDLTAMLPYLSAYMGHSKISNTHYYIHLVPKLLESIGNVSYVSFERLLPEVTIYE